MFVGYMVVARMRSLHILSNLAFSVQVHSTVQVRIQIHTLFLA